MSDLISRQAAIDAIDKNRQDLLSLGMIGAEHTLVHYGRRVIEELPSAQPELIRCKDCLMHGVCRFEQGLGLDGFCSQAERRTDE